MFRFGGQLTSDQFNATGNAGINQFTYQTEYVGLGLHAGLQIPVSKKTSLEALGKINGQLLIQGTQSITQNLDLSKDPQFNGMQILGGYVVQLNHRINSYAGLHLGFQSLQSLGVSPVNSTELAFQPNTIFIGIRLFTN
jgi:hypothetical protein